MTNTKTNPTLAAPGPGNVTLHCCPQGSLYPFHSSTASHCGQKCAAHALQLTQHVYDAITANNTEEHLRALQSGPPIPPKQTRNHMNNKITNVVFLIDSESLKSELGLFWIKLKIYHTVQKIAYFDLENKNNQWGGSNFLCDNKKIKWNIKINKKN